MWRRQDPQESPYIPLPPSEVPPKIPVQPSEAPAKILVPPSEVPPGTLVPPRKVLPSKVPLWRPRLVSLCLGLAGVCVASSFCPHYFLVSQPRRTSAVAEQRYVSITNTCMLKESVGWRSSKRIRVSPMLRRYGYDSTQHLFLSLIVIMAQVYVCVVFCLLIVLSYISVQGLVRVTLCALFNVKVTGRRSRSGNVNVKF